jgi:hypothetical protein
MKKGEGLLLCLQQRWWWPFWATTDFLDYVDVEEQIGKEFRKDQRILRHGVLCLIDYIRRGNERRKNGLKILSDKTEKTGSHSLKISVIK